MKFWAVIFLLLSSQIVFSQEEDCEEETPKLIAAVMKTAKEEEEKNCPNKKKFKNLCMMIDGRSADDKGDGKVKYMYQRRILEGSCVDIDKDSPQVRNEKIRKAWSKVENELFCNNTQFDIQNGSLIKFAVASKFDNFIEDVIEWKVNLNKVDSTDQNTVLDYVKVHIDRNKGNPIAQKLQIYYDRLKKAGAKHKSEL